MPDSAALPAQKMGLGRKPALQRRHKRLALLSFLAVAVNTLFDDLRSWTGIAEGPQMFLDRYGERLGCDSDHEAK